MMSSSNPPPPTSPNPNAGLSEAGHIYVNRFGWFKYLSYIRTAVGILTVIIIWTAALDGLFSFAHPGRIPLGIYMLIAGCPVFLLEFGRIIRMCCGTNGSFCQVFALVLNFDRWQRGLFYAVICIPCFIPSLAWGYSRAAGLFLFITGALYVGKCFQKKKIPTYTVDPNAPAPAPATQTGQTQSPFSSIP